MALVPLLDVASMAFATLCVLLAASDEAAAGVAGPCILIILLTLRSSAISFSTRSCSFTNTDAFTFHLDDIQQSNSCLNKPIIQCESNSCLNKPIIQCEDIRFIDNYISSLTGIHKSVTKNSRSTKMQFCSFLSSQE